MNWEKDHVIAARARGVSWFHVAQQVGKCEHDIRRRYDPDPAGSEPVPVDPPDIPLIQPDSRIAEAAKVMGREGKSSIALSELLGCSQVRAQVALRNMVQRGLARRAIHAWPATWSLTELGFLARAKLIDQ